MTQVLIDRATLEQLVAALNEVDQHVDLKQYDTAPNEVLFDVVMEAMVKGRAALANAEPTGCTWTKDPDFEMGDTYDSSCGEKWSFIDGGPTENRVRFCQGCGKPVKLIKDTL